MEPEISHRCPSCGASVRSTAQFCPQCGRALKATASEAEESQPLPSSSQDLKTTPLPPVSKVLEPSSPSSQGAADVAAPEAEDGNHAASQQVVAVKDESLSKRQRVKEVARGVQENVRPRVEKLRQASSTMLEEASAIDPSLRFIIIAAFLFIIFVVMLLLSFIK